MQYLDVHIEYLDGRPAEDQQMPARFEPGQEKAAVMQMLGAINSIGVVVFEDNGATLIPIQSIKSVKVTVPSVLTAPASALDALAALDMQPKRVTIG